MQLSVEGFIRIVNIPTSISLIDLSHKFAQILNKFSRMIGLKPVAPPDEGGVFQYIITKGPRIAHRARRLPPGKLKAVQKEFQQLCKEVICQPSSVP